MLITFNIGDLVSINAQHVGVIISKKRLELLKDFMYRIHFCGDNEPDERWIFSDGFKVIL